MDRPRIAVVGGGIAGLVAAATLARGGLQPTLFEAAHALGGRGQTRVAGGFHFNQGPHALYAKGAFAAALADLGVPVRGGAPVLTAGWALWGTQAHPMPILLARGEAAPPLDAAESACLAQALGRIAQGDYGAAGTGLAAFTSALPPAVRMVIEALVRLTSYAHAPEEIDGKAALDQLQLSFAGVVYVDGGWGSVISGLAGAIVAAGGTLRLEHPAAAVRREGRAWQVEIAGQAAQPFDAVILATPPATACELARESAHIAAAALAARPLRAMCLDLGLSRINGSGTDFALGIDSTVYASLHSAAAELAPPGGGLLHLARYLGPDEAPRAEHIAELEELADRVQPGWRDNLVQQQRLVGLPIAHDYPRWHSGGRRAPVVVPDAPGLFLAGDWVGDEGMLSDAAAASALVAAHEAAGLLAGRGRSRYHS
jgi:phytoene dehydrogenase-like protein